VAPVTRGLALAILVAYVTEYVANAVEGTWSVRSNLPLHLTDAVTVVGVVALWRPRPLLVEIVIVTAAFAVFVGVADVITGANYVYLRHKPERSSLLDVMGPWPAYIFAGAAFALVVFGALAALAGLDRRGHQG
jgi:uncharacterized membrane protein YwaF